MAKITRISKKDLDALQNDGVIKLAPEAKAPAAPTPLPKTRDPDLDINKDVALAARDTALIAADTVQTSANQMENMKSIIEQLSDQLRAEGNKDWKKLKVTFERDRNDMTRHAYIEKVE